MTVTEKVQAVMVANVALVALVPAARIKAPGNWQNLTRPYIVHFPVSCMPTRTHTGLLDFKSWSSYQVSVFADTFSSGEATSAAVRTALDGVQSGGVHIFWRGGWYVGRETETDLEHFVLTFEIHEAL